MVTLVSAIFVDRIIWTVFLLFYDIVKPTFRRSGKCSKTRRCSTPVNWECRGRMTNWLWSPGNVFVSGRFYKKWLPNSGWLDRWVSTFIISCHPGRKIKTAPSFPFSWISSRIFWKTTNEISDYFDKNTVKTPLGTVLSETQKRAKLWTFSFRHGNKYGKITKRWPQ